MPINIAGLIEVDVKAASTLEASLLVDEKQVRYATALALNRTAEEVNVDAGHQIRARMTVRNPRFILPPATLPAKWRATRENLVARFRLGDDSGIGARRRAILDPFEEGGEKTSRSGSHVLVPTKALRPNKESIIPRSMFPRALKLTPRRDKRAPGGMRGPKTQRLENGALQIVGLEGTFVIDGTTNPGSHERFWGIWQRTGPARYHIRQLWQFRRQVRIPDLLDVHVAAARIVPSRFPVNFWGLYEMAMRTQKS